MYKLVRTIQTRNLVYNKQISKVIEQTYCTDLDDAKRELLICMQDDVFTLGTLTFDAYFGVVSGSFYRIVGDDKVSYFYLIQFETE